MLEPSKHHLITFCAISFINSFILGLLQNFLFDIVNQNKHMTFRINCALQILGIFNFLGSFFWSYFADRTKKHNLIQVFNIFLYGILFVSILLSKKIDSKNIQIFIVVLVTMCREFTLGSLGPVYHGLVLNYLEDVKKNASLISIVNIFSNFGACASMFTSYLISSSRLCDHIITCKLILFTSMFNLSSFLLVFIAPRFKASLGNNREEIQQSKVNESMNILNAFKKPSITFLYISLTIAGIYKCIISNIVPTFLRLSGKEQKIADFCFTVRLLTETSMCLFLSQIKAHFSSIFIFSIFTSAVSILIDIWFDLDTKALLFGEILKGFSRSTIIFSSVLIFKSYSTSGTLTQTQGLRNSAYNGLSCILFGIIALMLVPSDLVDPKTLSAGKKKMTQRMVSLFVHSYKYMGYILLITLVPAILARMLRAKNL